MTGLSEDPTLRFYVELALSLFPSQLHGRSAILREADKRTFARRAVHEGLPFMASVLPNLWKYILSGLEEGQLQSVPFFKARRGSVLPHFLYQEFRSIFHDDGSIIIPDNALILERQISALRFLSQLCGLVYKLKTPYAPELEQKVIDAFTSVEEEIPSFSYDDDLIEIASCVVEEIFSRFNPLDISPRHGPGAVATGEKQESKWTFSRFYAGIHQVYPYPKYFGTKGSGEEESVRQLLRLRTEERGVAKVVLVPKDSRGPRLISCEPLEYQFIQQGLGRAIQAYLERNYLSTKGQINFSSQDVNRDLAKSSSLHRDYATLDLESASDRVSLRLVERLFSRTAVLPFLLGTRSQATTLPDGRVVELSKFAPMGSALCFPVLSVCVWSLAVASLMRKHGSPLKSLRRQVFVYGDDVIVPSTDAQDIVHGLQSVGLKVNNGKSFIKGNFRESCGMDAYLGEQITPIRIRSLWTWDKDPVALTSFLSSANQLKDNGFERAASYIYHHLETIWGKLPYGISGCGYAYKSASSLEKAFHENRKLFPMSWNKGLQRFEFYLSTLIRVRGRDTTLDDHPRLFRDLVSPVRDPDREATNLIKYKLGWSPLGSDADDRRDLMKSLGF